MTKHQAEKLFSFSDWARDHPSDAIPGDRVDIQFDNLRLAIQDLSAALDRLVRADGKLNAEVLPFQAPKASSSARGQSAPLEGPQVLGPNAGGFYASDKDGAAATSADYAQVSIEWAEHMPDTIPPNTLAINAITGDHWSSRWWANKAAMIYQAIIGAGAPPASAVASSPTISLYYVATQGQTSFLLSTPDRFALSYALQPTSRVQVSRNGARLMPDDGSGKGAYTVSQPGNQVSLLWPAGQDETIAVDVWEPLPPSSSGGGGGGVVIGQDVLTVVTSNVVPPLTRTPNNAVLYLVVSGRSFFPPADFTVSGNTVTWLNTAYTLVAGTQVVAVYTS